MRVRLAPLLLLPWVWLGTAGATAGVTLVDGFESAEGWSARPSDGVDLAIRTDAGYRGRALRLDFRFNAGGGYAVAHKDVSLDLPENYAFVFRVRGECLPNNLEFKLIDSTGENVWWSNQRNFHFPTAWDSVALKRRHIGFAWGPLGGGAIRHVAAIEFAVTAGSGGRGSVWLDQLELIALPPPDTTALVLKARASSSGSGWGPERAVDGDTATAWTCARGDPHPWLAVDLGGEREYGGLVVDWAPLGEGVDYRVEASSDGSSWRTLRTVRGSNGGRDVVALPESQSRWVRVWVERGARRRTCSIRELSLGPVEWADSPERMIEAMARAAPLGSYPRGMSGQQVYWTVLGVDGDDREALLSEDGMLETGKAGCSLEPFLRSGSRLYTWSDVAIEQSLDQGRLPIPSVRWKAEGLELTVTAFAAGAPRASTVYARYRVRNTGASATAPTLYLAVRPFQVNPPQQFLNTPGGLAAVREIAREGTRVRVNGERGVIALTAPSGFGAATFDQGDVVEFLRAGRLPASPRVVDPSARASGALAFALTLRPGETREVDVAVPLHDWPAPASPLTEAAARRVVEDQLAACRRAWEESTLAIRLALPDSEVVRTLEAQLAYIRINRDGPAIQPGSRAYERSWIRDGALTSSALLRLGQSDIVRDYIEWFAGYAYPSGKIPCCVDARGADPVPEHDSSGEFIYLVAEYLRYTGDRGLAERMWPRVRAAAAYLDSLRRLRRTEVYRAPGMAPFFGLLPPSISHEGYSAKPMHSYWDDLFALRGFKDAVYLAAALGRDDVRRQLEAVRAEFEQDLGASVRAAMAAHHIDYIPGCADLGDFDATSTTIALDPVQAQAVLPQAGLRRTFEKYWEFFTQRRDGKTPWDAFTPYEVRVIGAFVQLGWRDRATEALAWFLTQRRPPAWAQWPEVVRSDPRAPGFLGDLPHTWVGSDYVRSVLDMLAYERQSDSTLVLAAGVPYRWVASGPGVEVRGLRTPHGSLDLRITPKAGAIEVRIGGDLKVPRGGIVLAAPPPPSGPYRTATLDGDRVEPAAEITLRKLPATVTLTP